MTDPRDSIARKLEKLYSVTGIPLGLLSKSSDYHHFIPAPPKEEFSDFKVNQINQILTRYNVPVQTPLITCIASTTLLCLIQLDEDLILSVGPSALNDADMHKYLRYMNDNYSPALVSYHMKLVAGAPKIEVPYLCNLAIHILDLLCDKEITVKDIRISDTVTQNDFAVMERFLSQSTISVQQLSFENEIYDLVKNGNVTVLEKTLKNIQLSSYYYFQENGTYFLKFAFSFYAAILCHYATLGGLSAEVVRHTLSQYLGKLQSTHRPDYYWRLLPKFAMELCQKVHDSKIFVYDSDIINRSLSYIKENIYSPITIQDLETITHATSKTITRHFSKYLQTTPAQYISNAKLEEAAYLLRKTDLKIIEIAHLLHYSSQTHFNKNFQKKYEDTPRAYRAKYRAMP